MHAGAQSAHSAACPHGTSTTVRSLTIHTTQSTRSSAALVAASAARARALASCASCLTFTVPAVAEASTASALVPRRPADDEDDDDADDDDADDDDDDDDDEAPAADDGGGALLPVKPYSSAAKQAPEAAHASIHEGCTTAMFHSKAASYFAPVGSSATKIVVVSWTSEPEKVPPKFETTLMRRERSGSVT